MNFTSPVSNYMSTGLITVIPGDSLAEVKKIFATHKIHHIPVVRYKKLVGIISKTDYLNFLKGIHADPHNKQLEEERLKEVKAEEIMTTGLATLESTERINVAIELFQENLFHAIPIVDNGELVGMLTTLDIIKELVREDYARIRAN